MTDFLVKASTCVLIKVNTRVCGWFHVLYERVCRADASWRVANDSVLAVEDVVDGHGKYDGQGQGKQAKSHN